MVVNGRKKGIIIDRINGYFDHAHMLFAMKNTQSISEVMHLVKGESSRWINSNRLTSEPFQWQDDYFALSVSKSNLHSVRLYIDGQEKHHKEQTYYAECKAIM